VQALRGWRFTKQRIFEGAKAQRNVTQVLLLVLRFFAPFAKNLCALCGEKKRLNRKERKEKKRKERKGRLYKYFYSCSFFAPFAKNLCALCGEKK
jgi:membrane protein YqaA with SNARE-associated domain